MKTLAVTLCIIGTALTLSACETGSTYDSGASYANSRTAGNTDYNETSSGAAPKSERVFREVQTK